MRESAVGNRGPRKGGEPLVEDQEIRSERGDHRDLLRREAVHDVVRVGDAVPLLVVRLDETLQVGGGRGDHQRSAGPRLIVVARFGLELALILRQRLYRHERACDVRGRLVGRCPHALLGAAGEQEDFRWLFACHQQCVGTCDQHRCAKDCVSLCRGVRPRAPALTISRRRAST
jgi:hypothetical protein